MNDILNKVRNAAKLAPKPVNREAEKQERTDRTYSPDAKKAREVVRYLKTDTLGMIALGISKVTSEQAVKHRLQEVFENYAVANRNYMVEELKDPNVSIGWMGGRNGVMPDMPAGSPQHKVDFANAWNAMLRAVNEATHVGVEKRHREHPITLIADLESTALIVPNSTEWDD